MPIILTLKLSKEYKNKKPPVVYAFSKKRSKAGRKLMDLQTIRSKYLIMYKLPLYCLIILNNQGHKSSQIQ
jgi:hypothetical protein